MKASESCGKCGSRTEIESDDWPTIERTIRNWRTGHICLPPGHPRGDQPMPGGSTCGVIGFHPQFDHDTDRIGGVTA